MNIYYCYNLCRVIQMNMEIALVCAQLCVMGGARLADDPELVGRGEEQEQEQEQGPG